MWWRTLLKPFRRLLRAAGTGLIHYGQWAGPVAVLSRSGLPLRTVSSMPPAGHPERLLPELPPSAEERRLWAQLGVDL